MSETFHLERRNGVYYYRRRVPDHAVAAIGARTVKYSLSTSDKKEARKRREIEDLKWRARFEAIADGGAAASVASHTPLSIDHVVDVVRDYVTRVDRQSRKRYEQDPPRNGDELEELRMDAEIGLSILRDPSDPRASERVLGATQKLALAGDAASAADVERVVRRGLLELERRRLGRVAEDFSRSHFDDLFNPDAPRRVVFKELADQ